ncbi:MAG: glycoside hydrolase family 26 protein [Bacillota bacterium]
MNTFVYADTIDSISTYIKNGKIVPFADFLPDDDFKEIQPIDEKFNEYTDYAYGYSLKYPNHMQVDVSLSSVRTLIYDEDTRIEIYYDNFFDTHASTQAYINYSNQFMKNDKDHFKEYEANVKVNDLNAHILKWSREKLYRVKDDKNFYVSAEIAKNSHEVYTIFIKSAKPFENAESYMDIINSFRVVDRIGVPKSTARFANKEKKLNEETEAFYNEYFLESEDIKWGIFEYSAPKSFDFLHSLEKRVDYTFDFLVLYQSLSSSGFPMEEMENAYKNNRYVELTLQTMYLDGRDNSSIIYEILKGQYDQYFYEYAQNLKKFGHPVLFRLNNEMNGDWCPYSNYYTSKDTELFNQLWRYIYDIFEKNGVDNVLWVWNPHDGSFPNFKWNHYLTYYPGDEYVDIIGMTGYNAGTYYPGEKWRSFRDIYTPLYNEYMTYFEQPFMITEFGSNSVGGDKIMWIHEMFDLMKTMKNIKVAIWWNGIDWDKNMKPARIYRLDESDTMLRTFEYRLREYKK